jgi:hypothetical protein
MKPNPANILPITSRQKKFTFKVIFCRIRFVRRLLRHISKNFSTSTNVTFVARRHVFHVLATLAVNLPEAYVCVPRQAYLCRNICGKFALFGACVIFPAASVIEKPHRLIFRGREKKNLQEKAIYFTLPCISWRIRHFFCGLSQ